MAVTNLTGETWVINEVWDGGVFTFTVNFISNNTDFSQIRCISDSDIKGYIFKYDTTEVSTIEYGNTSWVNEAYRTVTFETAPTGNLLTWLQSNGTLTPPAPVGYEVTFITNGGTSVTNLTEQTALPNPLPTTTKANHVFAGWYYDNLFTQKATAGATIESNVTLYAKWHTPTSWCEDIADAIREKDGTTDPIKHLDFPERVLAIDSGIDVSDANALVDDVLTGKTFYAVDDTKKTGTMSNHGTVNTDITTKAQEVTIQQGYHSGSGKVKISTTEQAKIVADNIKSGVSILGQAGAVTPAKEEETKTVAPNFASGNVVVTPTSGKVMSQVTINKDTTNHIAGNIKKDITLYGVTGTYEGEGETLPTLRTVSISKSEHTLTISNPSTNGNFVTGYKIYSNGTLIASQVSTTFDLDTLSAGVHSITVRAYGTNFNDSNASSAVSYAIYSISNILTDITNSNTATKIGMTQAYTGTLSAVTGKYLPDSITVTMGGNPATYTYNNTTGVLSIISVTGNVVITAEAQAKLDAPIIDLTGSILAWTTVDNATVYSIRSNGTEVATSAGMSIDLSTILTDDGEYVMTVVATANGYRDSNASNSVTFTVAPSGYSITTSVTNGTKSGDTSINYGGTATVTITADSGYVLPPITQSNVVGATLVSDVGGVLTLSNPTGNVTITVECEANQYDYNFNNGELTIENAPYSISSGELTIE